MRILAIDDCGKSRSLIAAALGAEEHELRLAGSGREGLAELQRGAVDVLITEVLMPIMDGLEVIKAARRSHPDLWIIAISGGGRYLSADVALTFARAFGADRILYKPFVEAELKAAIEPAEGIDAAS